MLLMATDFRNEVTCRINLTCLCRFILAPSPNRRIIVYCEAVLNHFLCNIRNIRTKIKQDIRCFIRSRIYCNRRTAFALRRRQNDSLQRSVFLLDDFSNRCFGLQRHEQALRCRAHDRCHPMICPIPVRKLFDDLNLKIPTGAFPKVRFDDVRYEHPRSRLEDRDLSLRHNAQIRIYILKCLAHTFTDARVLNLESRLSADDKLHVSAAD